MAREESLMPQPFMPQPLMPQPFMPQPRRTPVDVGAEAPDFTLEKHDGTPWTLSAQRGKRVVLAWYPADWCPASEREHRRAAAASWSGDGETVVVGIGRDPAWSHDDWRRARELSLDLLSDPELEATRAYGLVQPDAPDLPRRATVVVDPDGRVAHVALHEPLTAERDWDALAAALAR